MRPLLTREALRLSGAGSLPALQAAAKAVTAAARSWAAMLSRVFEADPLLCPACGERMAAAAVILEDGELNRLLTRLGLPTDFPRTAPARSPPRAGEEDVQSHPDPYPDVEPLADALAAA